VDSQIDESLLCGRVKNKPDDLFSQRVLSCEDKPTQEQENIEFLYEPDDGECPPEGDM